MKAVRYYGPGQPFRLEEIDRREPGAGEVLVQVTASGMCHTELHFRSGLLDLGVAPITMGHEVVGRIAGVGDGVSSERVGERVIVYYYLGCWECAYCRAGDEHLCLRLHAEYGFISDGGYAEYMTVPARNAVPLPATVSHVEAAPIGCAVTTAVHATKLAEPEVDEWVVVYGVGGVGYVLIQLAHAKGARVIAVGARRSWTKRSNWAPILRSTPPTGPRRSGSAISQRKPAPTWCSSAWARRGR